MSAQIEQQRANLDPVGVRRLSRYGGGVTTLDDSKRASAVADALQQLAALLGRPPLLEPALNSLANILHLCRLEQVIERAMT